MSEWEKIGIAKKSLVKLKSKVFSLKRLLTLTFKLCFGFPLIRDRVKCGELKRGEGRGAISYPKEETKIPLMTTYDSTIF